MNKEPIISHWGTELKGKLTENNSQTLCIILPGIAYLLDRSYLDYSKQLALELGHDVLEVEYGFHVNRSPFNINEEFDILANETIKVIESSMTKEYKDIVIIGKSIGTCLQVLINKHFNGKISKNIYISPIDKTANIGITENSLVITGTKDPLLSADSLSKINNVPGVETITIADANHALDIVGNVNATIKVLLDTIKKEKEFLK